MRAVLYEATERKGLRQRPSGVERGPTREKDLDALFRELDEEPAAVLAERKRRARGVTSGALMATGAVLIGVGFLYLRLVPAPGPFLSVFMAVNVAAVTCIIAAVLLLPEPPKPSGRPKR